MKRYVRRNLFQNIINSYTLYISISEAMLEYKETVECILQMKFYFINALITLKYDKQQRNIIFSSK